MGKRRYFRWSEKAGGLVEVYRVAPGKQKAPGIIGDSLGSDVKLLSLPGQPVVSSRSERARLLERHGYVMEEPGLVDRFEEANRADRFERMGDEFGKEIEKALTGDVVRHLDGVMERSRASGEHERQANAAEAAMSSLGGKAGGVAVYDGEGREVG